MDSETNNTIEDVKIVETVKRPLVIFKTDADKYGRDITLMSDFFDGYIQQMALSIREQSNLEVIQDIPFASIGIINDAIHQAGVILKGNVTLLPDFDSLPMVIKDKLNKGIYTVGESKQIDGNLRAVILDEEGVRVKDITLKKVISNTGNIETIRSIGNQIQMRQIYARLADIQELQTYQLEKDRDRDIIVPFLDARSLILEAEHKQTVEGKIASLKAADDKIRTALNAIYADIETTTRSLVKRTNRIFLGFGNSLNSYMSFLTSDLQIATKYVGVRIQLLEYLEESNVAKEVLQSYQHVIYDFLTKPVTRKGITAVNLMHDYFPYTKDNLNCWHYFSKEIQPALEKSKSAFSIGMDETQNQEIYVITVENDDYEQ
ncbi:hypothetical protein [Parvimonas micra]